jgi:hypothetical protein
MSSFPDEFLTIIIAYSGLFSKPVFAHARLLLAGAILAPGKRTVTSVRRVVGLSQETRFHKYHRVLSLARWCALQGGRILLSQLLSCFLAEGPVVVGIDETLERRWGGKIKKRGIYRDSVRSSHSNFVKCSGLRWICLMLLLPIGWAARVWALPFLTVLAPSERYAKEAGKRHKKVTDWARQMLLQLKRWLPYRQVIAVGDSSYAVIELLAALSGQVTFITRLRLDAALYAPAPAREPGKPGRGRKKGERLPTLQKVLKSTAARWQQVRLTNWYGHGQKVMEIATATALWYHSGKPVVPLRWVLLRDPEGKLDPVALLSTDLALSAEAVVVYFARRWSVEVTLEETRAHLGMETQRQWSEKAIERSTPVLLGLFSIVTLLADRLQQQGRLPVEATAWYRKEKPTFSDAIAAVRRLLWKKIDFSTSDKQAEMVKIPQPLLQHFQHMLANAA